MDTYEEFVAYFTDEEIPAQKEKNVYYTPADKPRIDAPLMYMSERLGVQRRNSFTPSFPLLEKLAARTDRTAVLNEKASWLFICGNNALKEGIERCEHSEGYVIVTNEKGEVLGYGKRTGAGITNALDRGDYLRRE